MAQAQAQQSQVQEVLVTRVRFAGRRWKTAFLEDLMELFKMQVGPDTLVRLNSFLTPRRRFPITDYDIFKELSEQEIAELRRKIEELLEEHGYSPRRLLTIKVVRTTVTLREMQMEASREDVGSAEERAEAEQM